MRLIAATKPVPWDVELYLHFLETFCLRTIAWSVFATSKYNTRTVVNVEQRGGTLSKEPFETKHSRECSSLTATRTFVVSTKPRSAERKQLRCHSRLPHMTYLTPVVHSYWRYTRTTPHSTEASISVLETKIDTHLVWHVFSTEIIDFGVQSQATLLNSFFIPNFKKGSHIKQA